MGKEPHDKISDMHIRHYIYTTLATTSRPPTTGQTAVNFELSIADVESAFDRLADAHHIALAPGSYSIWMAHPFSGIPTNYKTTVGGKEYWGN